MRHAPFRPAARARFTDDSRLRATILRMIATNSLVAFSGEVGRTPGIGGTTGVTPVRSGPASGGVEAPRLSGRLLEAVPPQPSTPLPRGSLLDLRV